MKKNLWKFMSDVIDIVDKIIFLIDEKRLVII